MPLPGRLLAAEHPNQLRRDVAAVLAELIE